MTILVERGITLSKRFNGTCSPGQEAGDTGAILALVQQNQPRDVEADKVEQDWAAQRGHAQSP
jgi:hypothetical protein